MVYEFSIILYLIVALCSFTILSCLVYKSKASLVFLMLGAFASIILGLVAGAKPSSTYEERYKIIVSDKVSFNEFMNKYEIIERDNDIYIVKIRSEGSK